MSQQRRPSPLGKPSELEWREGRPVGRRRQGQPPTGRPSRRLQPMHACELLSEHLLQPSSISALYLLHGPSPYQCRRTRRTRRTRHTRPSTRGANVAGVTILRRQVVGSAGRSSLFLLVCAHRNAIPQTPRLTLARRSLVGPVFLDSLQHLLRGRLGERHFLRAPKPKSCGAKRRHAINPTP